MKLISLDNTKTIKGEKKGYITGILYLAPNIESKVINVCPMAKVAGCDVGCLYSAGRGKFNNVRNARIRKTVLFYEKPNEFLNEIANDIFSLIRKAERDNKIPLIRLNGTSDILWERKSFILNEEVAVKIRKEPGKYKNIMELYPEINFYDYTKIAARENLPENYDLTFSYSGTPAFQKEVNKALSKNMRMAVVFRTKEIIPETFLGKRVINGDDTDLRPLEPQGVIISLFAKGDAKKDKSGFVVDINPDEQRNKMEMVIERDKKVKTKNREKVAWF